MILKKCITETAEHLYTVNPFHTVTEVYSIAKADTDANNIMKS